MNRWIDVTSLGSESILAELIQIKYEGKRLKLIDHVNEFYMFSEEGRISWTNLRITQQKSVLLYRTIQKLSTLPTILKVLTAGKRDCMFWLESAIVAR